MKPIERLAVLEERVTRIAEFHEAQIIMTRSMITRLSDQAQMNFAASDKAIDKAEAATDKRFEAVNEFRSALSDQAAHFVTRDLHDQLHATHNKDTRDLRDLIDKLRSAQSRSVGIAVGVSSTITTIGILATVILRLATGH